MKPEDVPEEWVVAAMAAYSDNEWRTSVSAFRAALAAVIPLIEARERQACERLAKLIAHQFEQDDPRHETGWVVADAIRARGGA